MTASFHRLVQRDVWGVIDFYEEESGARLADEFYAEFTQLVSLAAGDPGRFHFDTSGLRRANLIRFPYHFLYRVRSKDIFILILRHHRRHPLFGLHRLG